jgi:transposase
MEMAYVGIDVSKDRLDVHVRPEGETFVVARDGKGLTELVERMGTLGPERIAVEATGGFETVVAAALAGASLPVVVVNPAQVRHFAQALGRRAKTDPIDASMIARFVEATRPDLRPLADEATQLLADLVARRRQIIEMIVAERNREKRVVVMRIRKSIARLIAALEKELSEIDGEIDAGVRGSPAWREKEDLLASVPGVGSITARTLIAELPELGNPRRQADRKPRRARPIHPPIRPVEGQSHDRRRPQVRALRPLSREPRRLPSQPRPQGLSPTTHRRRQAQNARRHRRSPQTPHHPQCHPARQTAMAPRKRLTANTVAEAVLNAGIQNTSPIRSRNRVIDPLRQRAAEPELVATSCSSWLRRNRNVDSTAELSALAGLNESRGTLFASRRLSLSPGPARGQPRSTQSCRTALARTGCQFAAKLCP